MSCPTKCSCTDASRIGCGERTVAVGKSIPRLGRAGPAVVLCFLTPVLLACAALAADRSAPLPPGYKLVYEQKFEQPSALDDFVMTDPSAWKMTRTNGMASGHSTTPG